MSRNLILGSRRRGKAPSGVIAPDWEIVRNFNDGTLGAAANGTADGFTGDAPTSYYTADQSYEGGKSCELNIAQGASNWGGVIQFTNEMAKGDTLWLQHYIRIPTAVAINTIDGGGPGGGNGSLKYIRIRNQINGVGTGGYFDLQFQDDSISGSDYRMIKEGLVGNGRNVWENFASDGTVVRDAWMRHTLCLKLDDVLAANGGTSRIRFWQDGVKLVDSTTIPTLNDAAHTCDRFLLFSYWNGTPLKDEKLYVDDIRIAKNGVPSWAADLT